MGLFDRLTALGRSRADQAQRLIAEGQALEERGRAREALRLYDEAITLAPALERAHLNRGNALLALGDVAAATRAYETAIAHAPASAPAHYNLGNALAQAGRHDSAAAAYGKAIEFDPQFADAEVALGLLHEDRGRPDEAAAHYERALRIRPDYAPVHGNLGKVRLDQGRFGEAVASYRRALELDPRLGALHLGLAQALHAGRQLEAAVASYRTVLGSHPDFAPAHGQLGQALLALGRHDEAAAAFRRVLQLEPRHVDAACLLGNVLAEQGHLSEALAAYRRMLAVDASSALAHNNIGGVLRRLGQLDEAAASYERALQSDPHLLAARSNLLFIRNTLATAPSADLLAQARQFGAAAARAARPATQWDNPREPGRMLRIGLVSGDLRSHPVGYFLVGVLASLVSQAGGRIEAAAYHNHASFDEVSARIKASCRLWRPVADLDDAALAQQIRDDRIDILIDLAGHTGHTRVQAFAWKPAPVQLSWLGYLATTGVEAIDYLIADAATLPAEEEPFFTETIWRLPQSYLCFTPPAEVGEVSTLPALAGGTVTFGSFNNLAKVTDDVVALWSRVLAAVPASRLLLKAQQLQQASGREAIAARFARHGIAGDRLQLEGLVARADYLKPFSRLDIALDPFPYPGITTSVECLWMGVPVLTLAGRTFFARQGAGLLTHAGLPEWIAADEDDYVRRAVRHASDLQALADLRARLRSQVRASPLFDAPRFARHFEAALRGMWQRWCAGLQAGPAAGVGPAGHEPPAG